MKSTADRTHLASRLGFLMVAAGCAVGLGNVWRFPYVAGRNGGGAFVVVYLAFLAVLGFPLLVAELALGRAAQSGIAGAMRSLAPERTRSFWSALGKIIFAGNFLLMFYYTDVAGWLARYAGCYLRGGPPSGFAAVAGDKAGCAAGVALVVAAASAVCVLGVRKGVERFSKWMMIALLALLGLMATKALSLPGAAKGLEFYLAPDWARFAEHPWRAVFDAMGQAFFTLSTGVGCMTIFGSYTGRGRSLASEAAWIISIDTAVALLSGLVIFPACASFGVDVASGPALIFNALPEVFSRMAAGRVWGFAFFAFLTLAAFTTIIAVFECIIAGLSDETGRSRCCMALLTAAVVTACSMPVVFFERALEMEDFVFGQFWLPLGSLAICVFSVWSVGWGKAAFAEEASAGKGAPFPRSFVWLMRWFVPFLILAVIAAGFAKEG